MAGIDELGPPGVEVDTQQLAGGVAVSVVGQGLVGPVGLVGQTGSCAAGATQGTHQDRGGQRGGDVVAHGVGHRQVQGVVVQCVVEGVAAEVFGGFQAPAQRELRGLARQRGRQQLVLDLCCQGGGPGAFAPDVEVGEVPVGDHDVGQDVADFPDRVENVVAGAGRQEQFEQPDGVPRLVTGTITRCPRPVVSRYSRWVRITSS